MKTISLAFLVALGCVLVLPNCARGDDIPGLYGTGVLDSGMPAPANSNDLHYTFAAPSYATPPQVVDLVGISFCRNEYASDWTNGPLTQWIGPASDPCLVDPALYVYRTTFNLTGLVAETARIRGNWWAATGNSGTNWILLNGTPVVTNATFVDPTVPVSVRITNGFVSGTNTLDFAVNVAGSYVNNYETATGIRVDISGTAYNSNRAPPLTIQVSSIEICWPAATGITYQVQYRSDLTTNLWENLGDPIPGTNGFMCIEEPVTSPQRYYRLQIVQ